jgi:hypothetical protein
MSATATQWNQIFQYEDGQTVHTVERGSPSVTSGPSHKTGPSRKAPKLASDNDQRCDEKRLETLA